MEVMYSYVNKRSDHIMSKDLFLQDPGCIPWHTVHHIYRQRQKQNRFPHRFRQIMIWFLTVRTAFNSSEGGLLLAIFYAGGYAVGTYVGGILAKKLIKGTANVQIVSSTKDDKLVNAIRDAGFGISVVNVNPSQFGGEKYMIFAEVDTKRIEELRSLIYSIDSKAFITVQETKIVYNGFIK